MFRRFIAYRREQGVLEVHQMAGGVVVMEWANDLQRWRRELHTQAMEYTWGMGDSLAFLSIYL